MKRKTFFTALAFVLIFTGFIYLKPNSDALHNSTQSTPPAPQTNKFLFGSMDSWQDARDNYADYDQLGMNFWHTYQRDDNSQIPGRNTPRTLLAPVNDNDRLLVPVSYYAAEVRTTLNEIYTQHNSRLFLSRPKIDWLCYAQTSKYQCEGVSHVPANEWFYTFNSNNSNRTYYSNSDYYDNSSFGGNIWVKRCVAGAQSECWVVDRLKANTEQCNRGNHWALDSQCDWLIKPRIRIEQTFANNQSNENIKVCRIDVYNQDGYNALDPELNKIKSIDIRVRNFKPDRTTNYDGNYIEEYYFLTQDWQDTSSNNRTGDWGDKASWSARGHLYEPSGEFAPEVKNHADIQDLLVWQL